MTSETGFLETLKIASPCPASWEGMTGDDRVRACEACHLNVYNLSAMTRAEAEELVRSREGRMCIRMLRRADGTVITRDCPKGLRALRLRIVRAAAFLVGILTLGAFGACRREHPLTEIGTRSVRPEMGDVATPESRHAPESRPDEPAPVKMLGEVMPTPDRKR